ncbi:hypothetical protein AMTR_s00079p00194230 [Amborella trichopoda]|uniref:Protein kinase domain-containing protein n=1 Tax=Amborella trichopoda TaxID=13333 RepID=W1P2H8_AMBTC|nr:hypothetical protein AMTR_s00079p00194230 [Amborella trichopoda]
MLYDIAIGVARGVQYLHCGCNTHILHFDIKPHNILLDHNFHPKISDFGLARPYSHETSKMVTLAARGTFGYMAPEILSRNHGAISHKSDGKGRTVIQEWGSQAKYTFQLTYKQLVGSGDLKLGAMNEEGEMLIKKMVMVGLWCIQLNPCHRPSMRTVIEMLMGDVRDLEVAPKPFVSPARGRLGRSLS